jgi:hypothetical protein
MSSIARKPHCIRPERTLAMPRHLVFVDTETKAIRTDEGFNKQQLILGWTAYLRREYEQHKQKIEWCYFETPLQFWTFLFSKLEKRKQFWVISRNIVFDYTVLCGWEYLKRVGFKIKFFYNEGLTAVISVKSRYGSIVFMDSLNWFVESIEKTGKRIGIPKLDIDFKTCSLLELSNYCHRDVEIDLENFKLFIKFLEDYSVSRLCYTKASTALSAYLFSHYKHKIYIHNNKEAIFLERESYKGGRTECFYIGELNNENYYILDVNSLYPFVMLNQCYPIKYERLTHSIIETDLQDCIKTKSVIAEVLLDTNEPAYAVKHDRTIFPVGIFWTVLTTPELKYAFEHNHIKKIKTAIVYEQADIFSSFVRRFYKLRQQFILEGNREYEQFCKYLLNSLYGKFGQKAKIWEKIGEAPNEPDRVEDCLSFGNSGRGSIMYLLGDIFECKGVKECYNSFPAIPAHVSAYGRMYLYELMKQAGKGNYFYCDTDSLIVNEVGLCNLQSQIDSVILGKLKQVSACSHLIIRGLKDYVLEGKDIIKGIRKNAIEVKEGVYEQEVWPSFKGTLRSKEANTYIIKKQTKILTRKYSKGDVDDTGIVWPLLLDESYLLEPLIA